MKPILKITVCEHNILYYNITIINLSSDKILRVISELKVHTLWRNYIKNWRTPP